MLAALSPIAVTPGDPEGIGPEVGVVAAAGQRDLVLFPPLRLDLRRYPKADVQYPDLNIPSLYEVHCIQEA